ncbi:exported hypothetical protein [uncultured spirochete]|jgi:hypothetical protein|uniref:Uncharacterized protein n=1 Tax=uncultured spirochete TaxID=156406 RepID=A0A3P3XHI7_9SPIR|nr:hypothetical protein [Rectinema subterraneum]SLM12023.1 exported hypothetical protein [uncultured spirochete]
MNKGIYDKNSGPAHNIAVASLAMAAIWLITPLRPAVSANEQKTAMLAWGGDLVVQTVYGQRIAEPPSRGTRKK